jgi:DNA excision repair protein ERCC-4
MTRIADKELLKRNDNYLKGGVFFLTFRQLVIDLLCKKLSPMIIDGVIVNKCHKTNNESESFIIKLITSENSRCFVKCFTDRPNSFQNISETMIESHMQSLGVNKLILCPRIAKAAKKTLDCAEGL